MKSQLGRVFLIAVAGALAIACPSVPEDAWVSTTMPVFDPTDPLNPIVPQPNDLIMDPATGRVAIPTAGRSEAEAAYIEGYMNTLDGFPVNVSLSCLFSAADVDPATVTEDTVQVWDVTGAIAAALGQAEPEGTGAVRLPAGSFTVKVGEVLHPRTGQPVTGITLLPTGPLAHGHRYAALVTTGVKTKGGAAIGASFLANLMKSRSPLVDASGLRTVLQSSLTDADAAKLEPARQLIDLSLSAIEATDPTITREQAALAWTFATHTASVAAFDPQNNVVPQPNDMVRGTDGTLDIPTAGLPDALADLYAWMNEHDGFSVTSAAEVHLTRAAKPGSVTTPAEGVSAPTAVLVDVTATPPVVVPALAQIDQADGRIVRLIPAARLAHGHTYLVALSRRIVTVEGDHEYGLLPSPVMALLLLDQPLSVDGTNQVALFAGDADAALLEGFRQALAPGLAVLEAAGFPRTDLASVFAFTTMTTAENVYDPATQSIPFPNDLVKGTDGLLNLPMSANPAPIEQELIGWMNTLDGFPHLQGGYVDFTAPIDPATVKKAFTFVKISGMSGLPTTSLTASAKAGASRVDVTPTEPLSPATTYAVVVTHDLKAADGTELVEANLVRLLKSTVPLVDGEGHSQLPGVLADADAKLLETNRAILTPLLDGLAAFGKPRDSILSFWVFTTHSHGEALYDPTLSLVPLPNDLLLTRDADLHVTGVDLPIPADASDVEKAFLTGLRKLDGFSALAASTTGFTRELDGATVVPFSGSGLLLQHAADFGTLSVGLADITALMKNPDSTEALGQLRVLGTDQAVQTADGANLVIAPQPGFPFEGGHTYMTLVLDGLDTPAADGLVPSPVFVMARSANRLVNDLSQSYVPALDDGSATLLEMLRQNYEPLFTKLNDLLQVPRERVLLLWTFTVQGITEPLAALRGALKDAPYADGTAPLTGTLRRPSEVLPLTVPSSNLGAVVIDGSFEGHLLLGAADFTNPAAPSLKPFQANADGTPKWSTDKEHPLLRVPFVLALPKGTAPAGGWPVVLFQHAMGRDKSDAWVLADVLAQAGFAVLALDAVWHGGRAVGGVDPSTLYMTPDPFVTRDHYRQTVLDQFELVRLLRSGALKGWLMQNDPSSLLPAGANVLSGDVYYVGMSLGAQLGAAFAAVEEDVKALVLNVPGAHLTKMLAESSDPSFRGVIDTLLQQAGATEASAEGQQLIAALQWALDPSDPVNYLAHVCSKPLDGHAKVPVLVQRAANDEFIVPAIGDEIVKTLENEGCVGQVQQTTYPGACHAFLLYCEGEGSEVKNSRADAIEELVQFLVAKRGQ